MVPIIKNRKIPFFISGVVFLASLIILFTFGLKPGIDFTGGTLVEVSFAGERPSIEQIEESLAPLEYGSALVQPTGENAHIIKTRFLEQEETVALVNTLKESFGEEGNEEAVVKERTEKVGPSISSELKSQAFKAAIIVLLAIIAYVAYAFRKVSAPVESWKYGVTAIIALVHDVVITMAVFSLLGKYLGVEVDIPFVVALLTILGYSVNDTIVVFDRVRENLIKRGTGKFEETVNLGVNQTFMRSINTSVTTLIVLFALFFFGGESIHYFSLALIVGIALGTYSSLFLASPLLVEWKNLKK